MNNYIKFYIEENRPIVKIRKNGKSRIIQNKNNISKLLDICSKYGYKIDDECIITDNVLLISHDYEDYIQKKKRSKIQIVGEIKPNMKLQKKDITLKKIIISTTLATVILGSSIGVIKNISNKKSENISTNTQYETQEEATTEDNNIELADGQMMRFDNTTNDIEEKNSYELQEGEDIVGKIETDSGTINIIGDESENKTYEEINEKNELTNMLTPVEFHYDCPDPIDINAWDNVMRYDDIFEEECNDFGIDKGYLEGKAAQETNGKHYENLEGGPAIGIMQIERTNLGNFPDGSPKYVEAYNFTTGQTERVYLTEENAKDLKTNIKIGAMMTQIALQRNNYNILVGTQEYNMGCGNMDNLMATCSSIENIPTSDLKNNLDNQEWLNYRESVGAGDPKYIEHVFRYLPDGYTIKIRRVDTGEYETLTVFNDYQKNKEY